MILLLTLAETKGNDLLSLRWPLPPRNILLVMKEDTPATAEAVLEFTKYAQDSRPSPQDSDADALMQTCSCNLPLHIIHPRARPGVRSTYRPSLPPLHNATGNHHHLEWRTPIFLSHPKG